MLPFFDDYLHAKNLQDRLTPSRDIDDERLMQSDWLPVFQTITEEPGYFPTRVFAES